MKIIFLISNRKCGRGNYKWANGDIFEGYF